MPRTSTVWERTPRRAAALRLRRRLAFCVAAGALLWLALPAIAQASADGCPRFVSASEGLPTRGEWRTHPALGDVNGDGRMDIAGHPRKGSGPGVWLAGSKQNWTPAGTGLVIPGFSCGVGVDLADVNGDGHLDLGVADHCQGLFVFLGDGGSLWRLATGARDRDRRGYDDLQFADLDGDGQLDIVALGSFRGGFSVFRGDGGGTFHPRPSEQTGLPKVGRGTDVAVGDVNGDGILDLAAAYSGGAQHPVPPELHRNVVWLGDGDGRFHTAATELFRDGTTLGVALGDVNGDGFADLAVTRGESQPLQVYLWSPEPRWIPALEGLPDEGTVGLWSVEIADVTGDGKADLVAVEHPGSGIRVWKGDGTGRWQECDETGLPQSGRDDLPGWGLAVGDVDRDGRADIAASFGRDGRGRLEVWLQKP